MSADRPRPPLSVLLMGSVLALASLGSCALMSKVRSKVVVQPPVLVEQAWRIEGIFDEPAHARLGRPSVIIDTRGQPGIAMANLRAHVGVQSTVVARRVSSRWRVEVPQTSAGEAVCARPGASGEVVVTFGDSGKAVRWDGEQAREGTAGPCPKQPAERREVTEGQQVRAVERSGDRRRLWDEGNGSQRCPPLDATPDQTIDAFAIAVDRQGQLRVALFEHPEQGSGRLRHAVCQDGDWTSSIVVDSAWVHEIGMVVDDAGHSHLAYGREIDDRLQLRYATTAPGEPADDTVDARVQPAIEACLRARDWRPPLAGVAAYQQGDPFRCVMLENEPPIVAQAREQTAARCEQGDAPACVLSGMLFDWLMAYQVMALDIPTAEGTSWKGTRSGAAAMGGLADQAVARGWYGRACALGDAQGCELQATLITVGDPRREQAARLACDAGRVTGCVIALGAGQLGADERDVQRAHRVFEDACDDGDRYACNNLGVVLNMQGHTPQALEAFTRACRSSLPTGCDNQAKLDAP